VSAHGAFPADHLDEATERLFELAQPPVLEERDFLEAVQLFEGRHELGEDRIGQPGRLGRSRRETAELQCAESATLVVGVSGKPEATSLVSFHSGRVCSAEEIKSSVLRLE
jgi:hypothetical protein